jgi:RES domain-containing protein
LRADPRWAHLPESGADAAAVGGRCNRPGVEARYFAETAEGALSEYQQESVLLPPATLATYLVTANPIVDFSGWYNPEQWLPLWAEAHCNWKALAILEGIEPPTWGVRRPRARRRLCQHPQSVCARPPHVIVDNRLSGATRR